MSGNKRVIIERKPDVQCYGGLVFPCPRFWSVSFIELLTASE